MEKIGCFGAELEVVPDRLGEIISKNTPMIMLGMGAGPGADAQYLFADPRVELLGPEGLLQAQNMLENTLVKSTAAEVTSAKSAYFLLVRYMPAYAAKWERHVLRLSTLAQPFRSGWRMTSRRVPWQRLQNFRSNQALRFLWQVF